MRLTCPNCGAQYAVDPGVIPAEGRDVQCSSCGHTWLQLHPDAAGQPEPEPPVEEVAQVPSTDPEVMNILREEAERERAARQADSAPFEAQPELAMEPAPAVEAVAQPAPEPQPELRATPVFPADMSDEERALRAAPRRSLLPDIEEINSTLGPSDDDEPGPIVARMRRERENRGRRIGFAIAIGTFAMLTILYSQGPRIAVAVPAFAPVLTAYVGAVDRGRLWLDGMLRAAVAPEGGASPNAVGSMPQTERTDS
ncbi:MAG: zinc-ribbon domain-containing protein [Pseudomonadota bacterium]